MIDLDRKWGIWSVRVWGLIVNLGANGLALYGAAGLMRDGSRLPWLVVGCAVSLICILVLAVPGPPDGVKEPRMSADEKEERP
jgi:hypothetical protein